MKMVKVQRLAAAGVVGAVGLLALLQSSPVSAQTITVPIPESFAQGPVGSIQPLVTQEVPADLVGESCNLSIEVKNNESVHPGNNLIIASGESKVTLNGVEDAANTTVTGSGTLKLGKTIDVSLEMGVHGQSSLGSNVTVTCEPVVTTTTSTTLPPPPTVPPVTSVTVPYAG